jgi:hypothetical protein
MPVGCAVDSGQFSHNTSTVGCLPVRLGVQASGSVTAHKVYHKLQTAVKAKNSSFIASLFAFSACMDSPEVSLISSCVPFLKTFVFVVIFAVAAVYQSCKKQQQIISLRRIFSLLSPVLLPTGSFCNVVAVLHNCSINYLLGAVSPFL